MVSKRTISIIIFIISLSLMSVGCVDQHQKKNNSSKTDEAALKQAQAAEMQDLSQEFKTADPKELEALALAKSKVKNLKGKPKIIATSPATADICDKLAIDLVGISKSNITDVPNRYKNVKKVGMAMAPDMEVISSLKPDWILSPVSLRPDLQPKYDAINTNWAFLNLNSVIGMYRSIHELGEIFDRKKEAKKLIDEFNDFYKTYKKKNEGKKRPQVLVLMGLPGSYIIATENSYVGSLVEMAGGKNVYAGTDQAFLTVNTEDMKKKEPDVILRAAHALPDKVIAMFDDDFKKNDIWKHFKAVKKGRVYDLTYQYFGMSATFKYPYALEQLQPMLYAENAEDIKKAKQNSKKANKAAVDSKASEKIDKKDLDRAKAGR